MGAVGRRYRRAADGNDCGLAAEFDRVLYAKDLDFPRFDRWLFKHDVVEASTAVKGQMLRHLLNQGAEKVVYLDPDIAVFSDLAEIIEKLDQYSVILTPHQVTPNKKRRPDQRQRTDVAEVRHL